MEAVGAEAYGMNARVRRFPRNTQGRDWVVGDIHGCFTTLDLALDEIGFDGGRDRLFSVGDLGDRGPESYRSLEYLERPWFHAVRGNHEQFLLETDPDDPAALHLWWANGGHWFHGLPEAAQTALRSAVEALPHVIEVDTCAGTAGIVHVDVPEGLDWPDFIAEVERGDPKVLQAALWGRTRAMGHLDEGVRGVWRVYCGHTPLPGGILTVGNVYFIDTGAVYGLGGSVPGAALTLMELDGNRPHARPPTLPPAGGQATR